MRDQDDLLAYYRSELAYLRQAGQGFAQKHPKLAERLEFSPDGSTDPHIERLLESFAFLTARIQRRLDDEFPEITSALLGILYPHLVNPIPPMSIAQFTPDAARGKLNSGYNIPRHTGLFSQTVEGLNCRFLTAYPVTLWPLRVVDAGIELKSQFDFLNDSPKVASVLRLRLAAHSNRLQDLELKQLRFCINGDAHLAGTIYGLLFAHCLGVALYDDTSGRSVVLPKSSLEPVGFGKDEDVIPYGNQSHPAYRLVQEYFALPEKFLFFDLSGLDRNPSEEAIDILFLLDSIPREHAQITSEQFLLGCTPIVNLFRRTSDPIRLDHTQTEYRLVPDLRRERTTEIHSILSVSASANPAQESSKLCPLYSASASDSPLDSHAYWYARREMTQRADISGTEMFLSFVDLSFHPAQPPNQTVYAHILCTNRDLALQLPENALLQTEELGPIASIRCLRKPTATAYPPLGGSSRWALISNLSLNYLSIANGPEALDAFRSILRLYSLSGSAAVNQQIQGIREMSSRSITRHISKSGWKGFCRGSEIHMKFDEQCYTGSSLFLFASVISRFLGLYASINSFTQLVTETLQRSGELTRFAPLEGTQPIL